MLLLQCTVVWMNTDTVQKPFELMSNDQLRFLLPLQRDRAGVSAFGRAVRYKMQEQMFVRGALLLGRFVQHMLYFNGEDRVRLGLHRGKQFMLHSATVGVQKHVDQQQNCTSRCRHLLNCKHRVALQTRSAKRSANVSANMEGRLRAV